ncbi:MAG: hypothetical protein ACOYOB_02490 [Myxococcota bacterium]
MRTAALFAMAALVVGSSFVTAAWAQPAKPGAPAPAAEVAPAAPAAQTPAAPVPAANTGAKETNCGDRKDDDGDGMVDCADADCKGDMLCKVGSGPEDDDAKCSDWFDNDGDGFVDCDDSDCDQAKPCRGSWQGPLESGGGAGGANSVPDDVPELRDGMTVEDLIGKGSDKDGERNDEVCSDGIDNDNDGKIDCADFGCRFDPEVTVCRGNPGMRFSVVAGIEGAYDMEKKQADTRFTKLQLRSFGPILQIPNSFYLVSMRAERTPRLTFAMFQVPLGTSGHFLNLNSGGGGLSSGLIVSTSKQLLVEPAYYLYNAFEQGNGAAVEVSGPLGHSGKLVYRAFAAGGSGRSTGNVGGRYFTYGNENYTYGVGGQVGLNVFGTVSRFDSPFLYTSVPLTWGLTLGAKYDQRAQERYPAFNLNNVFRYKRVVATAEVYGKYALDFEQKSIIPGANQLAYNVQVGVLAIPKVLLLAADYGAYVAGKRLAGPDKLETDLRKQLDEFQYRAAAHVYVWRNIGVVSLLYRFREVAGALNSSGVTVGPKTNEQEVLVSTQYRF